MSSGRLLRLQAKGRKMLTVLLVIQAIIAVAMVIIILIQRSSTDGLAGLSGASGGNSLISGRASANILTKTTMILAALFMANSLAMATITARQSRHAEPVIEKMIGTEAPAESPTAPASTEPAAPAVPKAE
ncbi:MAG: preprotein translocase subunit SecG [Rickettsiaceae bacterium]|jgi:preprotein translocase subunit SecG|nr:preprotein translocase subunit SecG [Rickettsiaceae bacterium]